MQPRTPQGCFRVVQHSLAWTGHTPVTFEPYVQSGSENKAMLNRPYFEYTNNPKTAEIYWTLVDQPGPLAIEGEDNSKPSAKYQKISKCRGLNSQRLFTELRDTEVKASLMDNPDISWPRSEASNSSGLATRIRDGKPGSPHRKVLGHGRQCTNPGSLLQTWSGAPSRASSYICEPDACRTALKWDHTPRSQIAQ